MGIATEVGVTRCVTTGKEVILWDVTDLLPTRAKKVVKPTKNQIIEQLTIENDRLRSLARILKRRLSL